MAADMAALGKRRDLSRVSLTPRYLASNVGEALTTYLSAGRLVHYDPKYP